MIMRLPAAILNLNSSSVSFAVTAMETIVSKAGNFYTIGNMHNFHGLKSEYELSYHICSKIIQSTDQNLYHI